MSPNRPRPVGSPAGAIALAILAANFLLEGCFLPFFQKKLDAPAIESVTLGGSPGYLYLRIRWNWVDEAEDFDLWGRDASAGGSFTSIMWESATDYSYNGWSFPLVFGHSYEFKVRAHGDDFGPYSEVFGFRIPAFVAPEGFTASTVEGTLYLEWGSVEAASSYFIEKALYPEGSWSSIAYRLQETSLADSDVVVGASYRYRIRAYSEQLYGYTDWKEILATVGGSYPAPEGLGASQGDASARVILTWTAVADADQYQVYRLKEGVGDSGTPADYSIVADWGVEKSEAFGTYTWADTGSVGGLSYGQRYYYRVRAREETGSLLYVESGYSSPADGWWGTLGAAPAAPQNLAADDVSWTTQGYIGVAWGAVAGAESYDLYRCAFGADLDPLIGPEDGDYALLAGDLTSHSYQDSQSASAYGYNRLYYYRAVAKNANGSSAPSAYDTGYDGPLAAPTSSPSTVTASQGAYSNAIIVSWSSVSDAAWYRVYRHGGNPDYIDESYAISGWIKAASFADTVPGEGEEYYKVKAMHAYGGVTGFSAAATGWTDAGAGEYGATYSVSGSVLAAGSAAGLAGASLALTGGPSSPLSATSGADGSYSFPAVAAGDYSLAPSLAGYAFSPASTAVTVASADLSSLDFEGSPVASYGWTDLGAVVSRVPGTVGDYGFSPAAIPLAAFGGGVAAGYLSYDDATWSEESAGVMSCSGSSWAAADASSYGLVGGATPIVLSAYSIFPADRLSLAAGGTKLCVGTKDSYSAYIYELDGSTWSANLVDASSFGVQGDFDDTPKELAIAWSDGLYAAQIDTDRNGDGSHGDYDVRVLSWDGSTWSAVGGDGFVSSSGNAWDLDFRSLGGTLYLAFTEDLNDDGYQDRLSVMHWSGTAWVTDLQWAQDYLGGVRLGMAGGTLYVSAGTAYFSEFKGGVFAVEGSSSVTLVRDSFIGSCEPITGDAAGNLFILSADMVGSEFYPRLLRYDGASVAALEGDYGDKSMEGNILALGTELYYLFGDRSSELTGTTDDPTVLRAARLSP